MVQNMEKDASNGKTVMYMMVISMKIKFKEEVGWYSKIKNNTMVNGLIIKCMEKVYLSGLMVKNIKVNSKMIKKMDMEL